MRSTIPQPDLQKPSADTRRPKQARTPTIRTTRCLDSLLAGWNSHSLLIRHSRILLLHLLPHSCVRLHEL